MRKFLHLDNDGEHGFISHEESSQEELSTTQIRDKTGKLWAEIINDGTGIYSVKYYDNTESVQKKLHFDAGQLADLVLMGTVLAKITNLMSEPNLHELKV